MSPSELRQEDHKVLETVSSCLHVSHPQSKMQQGARTERWTLWLCGGLQAAMNQKLSVTLKLIKASRVKHAENYSIFLWVLAKTLNKLKPEISGSDSHGLKWQLKLFRLVQRLVQFSMNYFPGHSWEHLYLPKVYFSLQEDSCSNSQDFPQCQLSSRHFSICKAPSLSVKVMRIWGQ